MQVEDLSAREIDSLLARQFAVLLGRAFTDRRHREAWTAEQRSLLEAPAAAAHAAGPAQAPLMPGEYLDRFPTLRNFAREPAGRREARHFVVRRDGYVAAHVSLWAQHFEARGQRVSGGYIEDVATDPLHLGQGLASEAMRAAEHHARHIGLHVLGLATGIPEFYQRLGWRPWRGTHVVHFTGFDLSFPDEPLMLLPLTSAGEDLARLEGPMLSWRLWRFGEIPHIAPD